MNPFRSKIKCKFCNKNYKKRKDRNKVVYICQSYDNYGQCRRTPIEDEFLRSLLTRRFKRELSDEEIAEVVDFIIVENSLLFEIYFTNSESPILLKQNSIQF